MKRCYYSDSIQRFLLTDANSIVGELVLNNEFATEPTQRDAWLGQIQFLKESLRERDGFIHFEYAIPRMGKRIDTVIVDQHVIFVVEFKVGQTEFLGADIDQVWDYALDLKNFHETSHPATIAPVLVATQASDVAQPDALRTGVDNLFAPIRTNLSGFADVYRKVLQGAAL